MLSVEHQLVFFFTGILLQAVHGMSLGLATIRT